VRDEFSVGRTSMQVSTAGWRVVVNRRSVIVASSAKASTRTISAGRGLPNSPGKAAAAKPPRFIAWDLGHHLIEIGIQHMIDLRLIASRFGRCLGQEA
jgi:hypothetical protein